MIVDFKRKFVFVHIPKCAGTAFENAFLETSSIECFVSGATIFSKQDVQSFHKEKYKLWMHSTAEEVLQQYPEFGDYRFLAITRNSLPRAASLWNYLTAEMQRRRQPKVLVKRTYDRVSGKGVPGKYPSEFEKMLDHRKGCDSPEQFFMTPELQSSRLGQSQRDYCKSEAVEILQFELSTLKDNEVRKSILEITGVDPSKMAVANKTKNSKDRITPQDFSKKLVDYLGKIDF